MRRAANADLAALDKIDARVAGLHPHVAAVVQDGFHLPVHDFHAHRSGDGDGFAVDDADGVGNRLVRPRAGCGD